MFLYSITTKKITKENVGFIACKSKKYNSSTRAKGVEMDVSTVVLLQVSCVIYEVVYYLKIACDADVTTEITKNG